MSNSRLIIIEGIPGSGKTSTACFVCEWLKRQGKKPALYLEGDWNHPADYESVACLDEQQYAEVLASFPEQASFLERQAQHRNGEIFFSYRKMQQEHSERVQGDLFKTLASYEIYELPVEKHIRIMRQGWKNFVEQALINDFVYVFECCFLQNPITTLMARHNLPLNEIHNHISALSEIVKPLQPKLVYLAPCDPRATLEHIRAERPKEWADYVTWYLTGQEYGKVHGLSGFEGVADFYAMRQALELEFLPTLPFSSVILSDDSDWQTRYKSLEAYLEK